VTSKPSGYRREAECEFCRIVRGAEPAAIVCQDRTCVAFFPTHPAVQGHTLVVPRRHISNLWQAEGDLVADLVRMVIRVGRALVEAVHPEGMNLITSAGEAASQTVFHAHLHVVPRWKGDAIGEIWPPASTSAAAATQAIADLVRARCEGAP